MGTAIGDVLPAFSLRNCDGETVAFERFCGAQALYIFAAHGWCLSCLHVSKELEALHDRYAEYGLATVVVLAADEDGAEPTDAFCAAWRDEHGHEDVITLYDPSGAIMSLWDSGLTSLSAVVDDERVVTSKLYYEANLERIEAEIVSGLGR